MYTNETLPSSMNRWRITAEVRTESPLHIGDGERILISTRNCERRSLEDANPKYATVFTAFDGKPYLPATSVKGALRAWATAHKLDPAAIREVFGDIKEGGAATFHDARFKTAPPPQDAKYRFWCEERSTGLTPQVVINPRTASAEESLLYYVEYVPEGAIFTLTISGQNLSEGQRNLLIYVLEHAFSSSGRPARLGGGVANGWGAMALLGWKAEALDAADWLRGAPRDWREALHPIGDAAKRDWLRRSAVHEDGYGQHTIQMICTLNFTGAMLVNDPTRREKGDADGVGAVGHSPIRKEDGRFYLPAESVRGAFRGQARRIWQTLAWSNERQNASLTDRNSVQRKDGQKALAGFFQLFGCTGWRAPIEVEDFRLTSAALERTQEFVAVDRFTGGAADKKKFKACGLWRPQFKGMFTVRVDRLEEAEAGMWVWLLLAFTLRDWIEGDGSIGFGRAKNYGNFVASVEILGDGDEADALRGILARDPAALAGARADAWARSLHSLLAEAA